VQLHAGPLERLSCFLDHPELELSNNRAENSMRPVATGRKNWIHIGSPQAGPRAILSVVESCRRLKIPVREYLANILPDLANATPAVWAAKTQAWKLLSSSSHRLQPRSWPDGYYWSHISADVHRAWIGNGSIRIAQALADIMGRIEISERQRRKAKIRYVFKLLINKGRE
jgi:hypothetical protein